jgi:hypothetical protein
MDLLARPPEFIDWIMALALLAPALVLGLLAAGGRSRPPHRAWIIALALQVLLVCDTTAALRSGRIGDLAPKPIAAAAGGAHARAAELFARAGAAVLALAAAAAALGGEARRRSRRYAGARQIHRPFASIDPAIDDENGAETHSAARLRGRTYGTSASYPSL